jgi:hypothetical protein
LISTYIRSSSYGTYSLCEFQFYMNYVLGLPQKPNFKTEKGSIVHKALELLAHRKVCEQDGKPTFFETEVGREFRAADVTVESALDAAWAHYTAKNESGHDWPRGDYEDCLGWTRDVVEFNDGCFNPLNRKVVCPERYFDFVIEEPWAWYDFEDPFTGRRVRGYLGIKGTIDLITEVGPGMLEYLDWKSGRMWDWANDKEKDYESLCDDPQLLLYFYALTRLYPEYDTIMVTIFFAQKKMPWTIPFDRDRDAPRALAMFRRRFDEVRNNRRPRRIMDDARKAWKCKSFCYYGKTAPDGSKSGRGEWSLCDEMNREVQQLGLERAMVKHGRPDAFSSYGSGGGQTNREVATC